MENTVRALLEALEGNTSRPCRLGLDRCSALLLLPLLILQQVIFELLLWRVESALGGGGRLPHAELLRTLDHLINVFHLHSPCRVSSVHGPEARQAVVSLFRERRPRRHSYFLWRIFPCKGCCLRPQRRVAINRL